MQMRKPVLMAHWDGAGNLPPQRSLARELVRRGHEVHVLSHDSVRERVEADGATFHPLALATQAAATQRIAPEAEAAWLRTNVFASSRYAADLLDTARRLDPAALLIDAMLLSALSAAGELRVPVAALWHSVFSHRLMERFDDTVRALPGAHHRTFAQLLASLPAILSFSYRELAETPGFAGRVEHLGPIREPPAHEQRPSGRQNGPFVLVSLSTGFQNQRAALHAICWALAGLDVDALVTTGPAVHPSDLPVHPRLTVVEKVPHDAVLASTDLVITHGGHGTVAAALGAGAPVLCLPFGRDQHVVAKRVCDLGLGQQLDRDCEVGVLAQTIAVMLTDRRLQGRARDFAARVDRFGDLARAADLVKHLLQSGHARQSA